MKSENVLLTCVLISYFMDSYFVALLQIIQAIALYCLPLYFEKGVDVSVKFIVLIRYFFLLVMTCAGEWL